jgi:hypothetical protein
VEVVAIGKDGKHDEETSNEKERDEKESSIARA